MNIHNVTFSKKRRRSFSHLNLTGKVLSVRITLKSFDHKNLDNKLLNLAEMLVRRCATRIIIRKKHGAIEPKDSGAARIVTPKRKEDGKTLSGHMVYGHSHSQ